jgi:hypothetical protein
VAEVAGFPVAAVLVMGASVVGAVLALVEELLAAEVFLRAVPPVAAASVAGGVVEAGESPTLRLLLRAVLLGVSKAIAPARKLAGSPRLSKCRRGAQVNSRPARAPRSRIKRIGSPPNQPIVKIGRAMDSSSSKAGKAMGSNSNRVGRTMLPISTTTTTPATMEAEPITAGRTMPLRLQELRMQPGW